MPFARNRAAFLAMVRAVRRMQDWLAAHGGEALAAITAPYYTDIARDILVSSLRRYAAAGIWAGDPEMSGDGFSRLAESPLSGGFLSRVPDYAECVDQSLRELFTSTHYTMGWRMYGVATGKEISRERFAAN